MRERSKSLIKNTVILTIGNICTKGIMLIITPLLTRWLSTEDYGQFDLFTSYNSLIIPLITLDIGEAAFRFLIETDNQRKKEIIVRNSTSIYLISFVLTEIILIILSIKNNILLNILPVFSLLLFCEAIYLYFTLLLRGLKRLDTYAVANILFVFAMAISAFLYVRLLKFGLDGIFFAYSTAYIVGSAYMCVKEHLFSYLLPPIFEKGILAEMIKFSLPLLPNAISWWVVGVSDRTIISLFLGVSLNAIYSVACKIPNVAQNFFNLFHLSWMQSATEAINDEDRDRFYSNAFNKMSVIMCTILACIASTDFILFDYIFNEEYKLAYYLTPVLCISLVFSMNSQFLGGIYIASKESKKNGQTTTISAIINICTHLLLIRYIGIFAAVCSTLISYLVLLIVRILDIRHRVNLRIYFKSKAVFLYLISICALICLNNNIINYLCLCTTILMFVLVNRNDALLLVRSIMQKIKRMKDVSN